MEAYPEASTRRRLDPSPHDVASRIVALQRKNASATGPTRLPVRSYEDIDEFNRGVDRAGPSKKTLFDPSAPPVHRLDIANGLLPPPRYEPKDPRLDREKEESRARMDKERHGVINGDARRGGGHDQYSAHSTPRISPPSPRISNLNPSHPTSSQASRTDRRLDPNKKLFIPDIHDPHHFANRSPHLSGSTSPLPVPSSRPSSSSFPTTHLHPQQAYAPPSEQSSGRSLLRRTTGGSTRTPEEEADRERERRRRREGSERGSLHSKRKDSDTRSKESRSSDGSESLRDRERGKGKGDTGIKAVLKDVHNKIRALEAELNEMHRKMALDPSAGISVLMQPGTTHRSAHGEDTAAWMDLIAKHKELADLHHLFLVRVFDPLIPSTFSQLAVKYNIPSRLWQVSFHLILERLRLAWMTAHPSALDLLTDLVYDAYKFYTDLLEDQAMSHFRTAWIEALGDLARYRMNIASHVSSNGGALDSRRGTDYRPRSRDDLDGPAQSSGASIGAEVAESWDVEDQETWRTTARDWYSMGVTEKPGEGRLHHHLALLCRDVPGLEPRALHHFTKSLVVTHEYATSRETILPLFDSALQSQRSLPEAKAVDLFVRLHGMLFTKIDLDNFKPVMSRYMERLDEDARLDHANRPTNISQVDWMIMASVNLAAMLQYGSPTGVIRKAFAMEGQERRRAHAVLEDDHEGEDDAERAEGSDEQHHGSTLDSTVTIPPAIPEESTTMPMVLTDAIEMTMEVFSFLLSTPFRQQGLQTVLNPYLTCLLTFIATAFRQTHIGDLLLPHVPWYPLVEFFNKYSPEIKEETKLVSHIPLPEDWALRGMEWVGRRVYERGFWKTKSNSRNSGGVAQPHSGERFASEMDVLLANFDSSLDISQGVVEEAEDTDLTDGPTAVNARRWRRVAWAAGVMVKHMDGLELRDGKVVITGSLKRRLDDISSMKEIQRIQEEEAMFRRKQRQQEEEDLEIAEQIESEIEDGDPEMAALRERRRRLRSMLDSALPRPSSKPKKSSRKSLHAMPGYTTLVFDTNVLLSSLELVKRVIDGGQWKVVVPLPVITELDGLSRNPPPLGESASLAITYLEARVRSHSRNLKIQTSKGNYLSDLTIRAESHHDAGRTDGTTMDDLILNVASFQSEHFRSNAGSNAEGGGAIQVLMVTFDRNLRLRARARGIEAADEKEMVGVWGSL